MSNDEKVRVKPVNAGNKETAVRSLTELRQDTTDKAQKALESRIAYFDAKREIPLQERAEEMVAKAISAVAELAQGVRKLIPEETANKLVEYWGKLMLFF